MKAAPRHPPNRRLTWERLERGWSHEELCTQIKRSMREAGEPETGLTANTVRRWETGERWPEPRFRKHLARIFGYRASELGLLTQAELAVRPAQHESLDALERLLGMLGDPVAGYGISRQRFLHALLGAGALSALAPWEAAVDFEPLERMQPRGTRLDPRVVDSYRTITGRHRDLYWTAPSAVLLPATFGHTQLGVELLSGGDGEQRQVLACAVAESALLGARLAFFDLRQPPLAERCFEVAVTAVRESGDHALAATVIAHRSFVPGFASPARRFPGLQPARSGPYQGGSVQPGTRPRPARRPGRQAAVCGAVRSGHCARQHRPGTRDDPRGAGVRAARTRAVHHGA